MEMRYGDLVLSSSLEHCFLKWDRHFIVCLQYNFLCGCDSLAHVFQ